MAAIKVKDDVSYGAAARVASDEVLLLNYVETHLSPRESTLVQSLIIRAHFGGMTGDVAMLHGFSRVWLDRFQQKASSTAFNPPCDFDTLRNPEIIDDVKTPWLCYLELIFDEARESDEARLSDWGGVMRRDDIPIAAVDFHVSNCVDSILQVPTIRMKIVDAARDEFGIADMDVTDRVKSAIWRHSAGVNFKQSIVLLKRTKLAHVEDAAPSAKDKLSLRIWEIIKEDLESFVKRYLAFRVPR
jgi:hypothetical protein